MHEYKVICFCDFDEVPEVIPVIAKNIKVARKLAKKNFNIRVIISVKRKK